MTQRGHIVSYFATSWLVLLACGGITERTIDDGDGSAAGGSLSSSATNHAGGPSLAGTGLSTPTPTSTPMQGTACYDDSDCPDDGASPLPEGSRCGGEVCNWNRLSPSPEGRKLFFCNWAGSDAQGREGWCTTDADCKCRGLGAKCIAPYCTFTRPSDTP